MTDVLESIGKDMEVDAEIVITGYKSGLCLALLENGKTAELHTLDRSEVHVGSIYVGKVQNVVKNINAAFVDFGCGVNGYLPLEKADHFIFTSRSSAKRISTGDELIVQVEREAVKTKLPVLTGAISISGRYAVVLLADQGISISKKINDAGARSRLKAIAQEALETESVAEAKPVIEAEPAAERGAVADDKSSIGLIVRTNAEEADEDAVRKELGFLIRQAVDIMKHAPYCTCFSCLYHCGHPFVSLIRDYPLIHSLKVVTDDREMYDLIHMELADVSLRFYEDDNLSLFSLYSLKTAFDRALSKRVWLKSGGYLVLEPTEALTVIDVNSGGNVNKMNKELLIYKTNMEAAKEIAAQLRLRNYSGIIIIDFIDMQDRGNAEQLYAFFRKELERDRIQTILVDVTRLSLAEVTRKRIRRPLHEAAALMQ